MSCTIFKWLNRPALWGSLNFCHFVYQSIGWIVFILCIYPFFVCHQPTGVRSAAGSLSSSASYIDFSVQAMFHERVLSQFFVQNNRFRLNSNFQFDDEMIDWHDLCQPPIRINYHDYVLVKINSICGCGATLTRDKVVINFTNRRQEICLCIANHAVTIEVHGLIERLITIFLCFYRIKVWEYVH